MRSRFASLIATRAPTATILVRAVLLSEGVQKFLYPAELGPGRFAKIGLPAPAPEVLAPFVGGVEVVAGTLVLIGLLTRPAALALAAWLARTGGFAHEPAVRA